MGIKNKESLKNYFQKGGIISEKQFVDLIDSSVNVIDDGIDVQPRDGLRLNPTGVFSRLISFFKKKSQKKADYTLNINYNNNEGLSINNINDQTVLKIKDDKVGINTDEPIYNLHVEGDLAIKSRVGIFANGSVAADGKWHKIIDGLDGINVFEVIASASGQINKGDYSVVYAIALSTFGGKRSRNKIKIYNANWYSFIEKFFNKRQILLRWGGSLHNYFLEIKMSKNWGVNPNTNEPYEIKFNIIRLNN